MHCGGSASAGRRCCRTALSPHSVPSRAWSAKPPGQHTDGVIEVSDSDDDAAAHHAMAKGFREDIVARIDDAAAPLAVDTPRDDYGGVDEGAAQAWPGHDERLAWAVLARAY